MYRRTRKKPLEKPSERIRLDTGEELAEKYRLHRWDYIVAGDGSGNSWEKPIGFGSILYSRNNGVRKKFFGGFSNGTSNVAEMMAVILPLIYIEGNLNFKNEIPNVYVFSDSLYVVNTGNGEYTPKTNRALWETIHHFRTRLNLNFVYEKRMLLPANVFGDQIGNTIRMDFQQFTHQLDTLYFTNPNEKNKDSK